MKELSLHILDIAQNSVRANASLIEVIIDEQPQDNILTIQVNDNGCGMAPELLARVTDPFTTTRTTRGVGLGIPLFKQACEQTGGQFTIDSTPGIGTHVKATLIYDNIDRMPLGDLPVTIVTLLGSSKTTNWIFIHRYKDKSYQFDTAEITSQMGEIDYNTPQIAVWLQDYLQQQQQIIYGGIEI